MNKILGLFFALLLIICPSTVFASQNLNDNVLTYEQYQQLVLEGSVSEDITYEELVQINEESRKLESSLSDNPDFILLNGRTLNTLLPGDVIITNSTSASGILGHAGISTGYYSVLHIARPGELTEVIDWDVFQSKYSNGWIKVYRPLSSTVGKNAAYWAERTYKGSNAPYRITKDLTTTNETYCSKIVFQAYYYGAGSNTVYDTPLTSTVVAPYLLPDFIKNLNFEG